jgi:hypothetical protein
VVISERPRGFIVVLVTPCELIEMFYYLLGPA